MKLSQSFGLCGFEKLTGDFCQILRDQVITIRLRPSESHLKAGRSAVRAGFKVAAQTLSHKPEGALLKRM